jgi:hypothetical protein
MPALQRKCNEQQIAWVAQHPLFQMLREGIDEGEILPCLRNGEIHVYERGARLLSFSNQKVFTHAAYAGACFAGECNRNYVALPDNLCADKFNDIREAARTHRDKKPHSELVAVQKLFQEFAVTRLRTREGKLALIDVEIRFGKHETDTSLPAKMIDLAFLLPNRTLLFVEAKCIGNASISSTTIASVVTKQVEVYEKHIQRPDVLGAMNRSLCAQSNLVGRELGQADGIFSRIPILRQALANAPSWKSSSGHAGIIDGTLDPIAAICQFAKDVGQATV